MADVFSRPGFPRAGLRSGGGGADEAGGPFSDVGYQLWWGADLEVCTYGAKGEGGPVQVVGGHLEAAVLLVELVDFCPLADAGADRGGWGVDHGLAGVGGYRKVADA